MVVERELRRNVNAAHTNSCFGIVDSMHRAQLFARASLMDLLGKWVGGVVRGAWVRKQTNFVSFHAGVICFLTLPTAISPGELSIS